MQIVQNVSLAKHSTMRLGGIASYSADITSRMDLLEALAWAETNNQPVRMIGGGSNIVWKDEGFPGLLLVNKIMRYELYEESEQDTYLTAGGGENWDSIVARSVAAGLTGIEALSLIPGTAGATPIQNVGAYGQEIANTLATLEAYDMQTKQFITMPAMDCAFGYRTSRFKTTDIGRFFITAIMLHLHHGNPEPPFYEAVQRYFSEQNITADITPQTVRDAVMAIRSAKLPNPAIVANNGSFFANPIIPESALVQLEADYADFPHWPAQEGYVKIPAAWLLEAAGFKGYHDEETGMATWKNQALVFVNEHAKSTADLLKFRQKVVDAVQAKFHITLEQEPELLP